MKYKVNKGFIPQKLDDKTVIFDADSSIMFTFNETAGYIFKKIKQGWNEEQIVDLLTDRYRIKKFRAKRDIKELIQYLKKNKILS